MKKRIKLFWSAGFFDYPKINETVFSAENAVEWSSAIDCSRDVINGTYSSWVTLIVQLLVARVVPTAVVPSSIDNSLHWSLESTYTEKKNIFWKNKTYDPIKALERLLGWI